LIHGAWAEVAENNSLPIPDEDETDRALGHRPEVAITKVFRWQSAIDDWGEAQSLAFDFGQIYGRRIREHSFTPRPGVLRLLETLNNYEVPCCLCSGLDEDMTEEAVADAGLDGLFQKVASQRPRRRVDAIVCTSPRSHGSPATAHCLP